MKMLVPPLSMLCVLACWTGCSSPVDPPEALGVGDTDTSGTLTTGGAGGCATDTECGADTPYCDLETGSCVACIDGSPHATCAGPETCCGGTCVDTDTDPDHCGACAQTCDPEHAEGTCLDGGCVIDRCDEGFLDCDQVGDNGCEIEAAVEQCRCEAGTIESCYTGPWGTQGVGMCAAGTRTCTDGLGWGPCEGEVLPDLDVCSDDDDNDCDGLVNNGFPDAVDCACVPGEVEPCYDGPVGTQDQGECRIGQRACNTDGLGFGFCVDQVLPTEEICDNGLDEDCDAIPDNAQDLDGDGWTTCDGDCCDAPGPACSDPALVNPGAYEVAGNLVDDDCDGTVDNPPMSCDAGLASDSASGLDFARAIDICQATTESAPRDARTWGVISADLLLVDGSAPALPESHAIRDGFGHHIVPHHGARLAVLSTGAAADLDDTNPDYHKFQAGMRTGARSDLPADWLAANGGEIPNYLGCPRPEDYPNVRAHNPVMLHLRVRVPTNARSFSMDSYFFSAEYPEYVCSAWNDFFVVLLDSSFSGVPANPADKNLAIYRAPSGTLFPVGVNLAYDDTGLFTQCLNGPTGCNDGSVPGEMSTCVSTLGLEGTGYDVANPSSPFGQGWCGSSNLTGGATDWLITRGNVEPGEIIELRIAVWDTGDQLYDSVVLVDNFQWNLTASEPGTEG